MTAKAENSGKQWSAEEDERLRELAGSGDTSPRLLRSSIEQSPPSRRGHTCSAWISAFSNQAALPVEMGLKVKEK
jgi:hypothetical protein